jgi:predicted RNase H-like HicB family nuclease
MPSTVADEMLAGQNVKLTIIVHACEEEGGFTAECVEIPGCVSEGETEEQAVVNIKDAVNACLSVLFEDCIQRLRNNVDLGNVNLQHVSKQERLSISIPQVELPAFA